MIIINLLVWRVDCSIRVKGFPLTEASKLSTLFFDLDETLYESSSGIWLAIRDRIGLYMHDRIHLDWEVIPTMRAQLFQAYGTTRRGLVALYDIDPQEYLDFVHDIPIEEFIKPDPVLKEILLSYPQRKMIFTNADRNHARRVLDALEIRDIFEMIIDIQDVDPHCKPMKEAFLRALELAGESDPHTCVMLDDSQSNLATASALGFTTIRVGSNQLSWDYNYCISRIHDLPGVFPPDGSEPQV
jgi:putative hydrolase of the HAD superfamily